MPAVTHSVNVSSQHSLTQWYKKLHCGVVLTPGKLIFVLAFWILGPSAQLLVRITTQANMLYVAYIAYFVIALYGIAAEYWPRHDPAAEGIRRARRLLPIDPGMALVRGRGALEHCLREAAQNLNIPVRAAEGQPGIHDLLEALRPHMQADLYQDANQLRRFANEAAHDPDWNIDRETARGVLGAAVRVRRWAKFVR